MNKSIIHRRFQDIKNEIEKKEFPLHQGYDDGPFFVILNKRGQLTNNEYSIVYGIDFIRTDEKYNYSEFNSGGYIECIVIGDKISVSVELDGKPRSSSMLAENDPISWMWDYIHFDIYGTYDIYEIEKRDV